MGTRAAVLTAHGAAPRPDAVEEPQAGPGEVLVDVVAAPITPLDVLCATGTSYFGPPALPYVPGVQGTGVVVSGDVLPPGTRVWFATGAGMRPGNGSMAARCAVPLADVVPLAHDLPLTTVAGLGLSGVAAWEALRRGGLTAGDRVVVLGAGGVVGQAGIQIARLSGAASVVAACRGRAAADRALALGADDVVLLDTADAGALAARFAAFGEADLVLDPLAGAPANAALRVLAPGGRLVNLGSAAGPGLAVDSALLRSRSLRILGYTNNELSTAERAAALDAVVAHAAAGRISLDVEAVPLDDVAGAWQRQADGRADRRIVLTTG